MNTNTKAVAKLARNARLGTVRLVVTFDTTGNVTVRNAAYVSGDLCAVDYKHKDAVVARELARAAAELRTDNIELLS
jgi:pyruvate-formate lyase-activating enzyme